MAEELKKLLPAPPTTIRGFATVESIFGYVDVYDSLQPAHSVDITTTVTRVDGTQVFTTTRGTQVLGVRRRQGGGYGVQFEVPLKDVRARPVRAQGGGQAAPGQAGGVARADLCRLRARAPPATSRRCDRASCPSPMGP